MSDLTVPPPPDGAEPVAPWASDSKARLEERNWTDEDNLKGQRHKNDLWVLRVLGVVQILLMAAFTIAFLAAFISWCWHYVTPWPYLKPDQLSKIQSIIFSGAIGGIVTTYARKYLPNETK